MSNIKFLMYNVLCLIYDYMYNKYLQIGINVPIPLGVEVSSCGCISKYPTLSVLSTYLKVLKYLPLGVVSTYL